MQFLDAFEHGKRECTQLRVVGQVARVDVLTYVASLQELTEEIRVLGPCPRILDTVGDYAAVGSVAARRAS
ncbi:hypothetical protein MPHLEI_24274 [Mycolicibacterium phlei RIVM601174]|nr:hypothetical protein MPHLEI_24274 [Mycolicibacterium phlei RIVM601174]